MKYRGIFILAVIVFLPFFSMNSFAQLGGIQGAIENDKSEPVEYVNVALFKLADSSLVKVELTDENGSFVFSNVSPETYFIKTSSLGLAEYTSTGIKIVNMGVIKLDKITLNSSSISLKETTVVAKRNMVEVRPDKTVFNVEGTINSIGSDAISLLRKAPGIMIDNNENISVLGRSGVLIYIDGKRLPLAGVDLSNYLQSLTADQIDRFDIITNPGAKYEAQGNAGIIDIRLKKDKKFGINGTINTSYSQGRYGRSMVSGTGNYRNKLMNIYGSLGASDMQGYNLMAFESFLNNLYLGEISDTRFRRRQVNYKAGIDYFLTPKQTIGLLVSGNTGLNESRGFNSIELANQFASSKIDSVLIANTIEDSPRNNQSYNINYQNNFTKDMALNIDLDYGNFETDNLRDQTNIYFTPMQDIELSKIITSFDTPSDIGILSFKTDFNKNLFGGSMSTGTKFTGVSSDNTFLFFDGLNPDRLINKRNSNKFKYDEKVYAAYVNYSIKLNKEINLSGGIRAEQTHTRGNLTAFLPELQEKPVERNYLSWFPSGGITWKMSQNHGFALNYGRRINRPNYNVLNPFNNQLSQLSFEKGNPGLLPEIVNNLELGYTLKQIYNIKIAYSKTLDQITRLIGPDDVDPRATYINWDNLASQTIWSVNASVPLEITKFWNAFINVSGSHINNEADYGNGAVVDLQAFSYTIFQQHTFTLPMGFNAEVSGYYSGPGIWGGVFEYDSNWSLDVGLQKRFFGDKLNVKISGSDLFFQSFWSGISRFNGLEARGSGRNDNRRFTINLSYTLGNNNVKSRKRETGMEAEEDRAK